MKLEADALRREINEWRDRAGVPRVEEPGRGEGFGMVISGEMEVLVVGGEEEEEDGDEFGVGVQQSHVGHGYAGGGGYGMDMEDDEAALIGGGGGAVQLGYGGVPPPPTMPSSVLAHHVQMQQHHQQQQQQQHAMAPHHHHSAPMHHHSQQQQQHHQMAFGNGNPFAHNLPPAPPTSAGTGAVGVMGSRPGTGGYDAGYFGYQQVYFIFLLCNNEFADDNSLLYFAGGVFAPRTTISPQL